MRELDRIAGTIADDAGACVERCDPSSKAIAEARDGAAAVCESAATIENDNDARIRCDRARDRNTALARRASDLQARCGCGPSGS